MLQAEHFYLTKCEFRKLPCISMHLMACFHDYRVNLIYSDVQDRIMVSIKKILHNTHCWTALILSFYIGNIWLLKGYVPIVHKGMLTKKEEGSLGHA